MAPGRTTPRPLAWVSTSVHRTASRYTGAAALLPPRCLSPTERTLHADYNLGWLRQEENQYLACPPAVAATMPPHMQRLVGYTTYGDALGYYGDFQHPREALDEAARAAKPRL